jgi:hypothetical protein
MYDLMQSPDPAAVAAGELIPYSASGSCVVDANFTYNKAAQEYMVASQPATQPDTTRHAPRHVTSRRVTWRLFCLFVRKKIQTHTHTQDFNCYEMVKCS